MLNVCPSHLWDRWLPYWMHMVHWSASEPRISLNLLPWPASVKQGQKSFWVFSCHFTSGHLVAVLLPWITLPWEDSGLLSFGLEGWCLAHSGQRWFESGWRPPERLWVDRSETETTAAIEQRHNTQIKRPGHFNRTYFYFEFNQGRRVNRSSTSLSQLSWGSCLVTYKHTKISECQISRKLSHNFIICWSPTWINSGSHWISSWLGSTGATGHFIRRLWGLPP